ncbi:MAG: histidine--tRNA ligase [Candidatus Omnitrophica bacterium]|nr:histidine--tRNA ligase [Candidatus Omnitrophota bacterium]
MNIQALRGTHDVLPLEAPLWSMVEQRALRLFRIFGFQEIRTPLLEEASLFIRAVGEASDIVQKEMYVLTDRGNRQICLRPEGTAGVVRAYLEHGLGAQGGVVKLFYIGAMFRAERPQAGRQRQFHQIGVESLGSGSPLSDVENVHLLSQLLFELGVKKFQLRINHLGCGKDRPEVVDQLQKEISPVCSQLCEDCQQRFERNILRILDCKKENCREKIFPKTENVFARICSSCQDHFKKVKEGLDLAKIAYRVDSHLVRGLDYYTGTVFEVSTDELGAQDTLAAGGRYDRLVEELGGKLVPATGWALGTERLLMVLKDKVGADLNPGPALVYIAVAGESLQGEAFKLLSRLRESGIASEMDFESRSLKGQFRAANKKGSRHVILLGEEEWGRGEVVLKDMQTGTQEVVSHEKILEVMKNRMPM